MKLGIFVWGRSRYRVNVSETYFWGVVRARPRQEDRADEAHDDHAARAEGSARARGGVERRPQRGRAAVGRRRAHDARAGGTIVRCAPASGASARARRRGGVFPAHYELLTGPITWCILSVRKSTCTFPLTARRTWRRFFLDPRRGARPASRLQRCEPLEPSFYRRDAL